MAPSYFTSLSPSHLELTLGPRDYTPFLDHNELECFFKQLSSSTKAIWLPPSHWSAKTKDTQSLPCRFSLWQSDHAFLFLKHPTRLLAALLQLSSLPPHLPPLSLWLFFTWTITEAHWLFLKETGAFSSILLHSYKCGLFKSPSYYLVCTAEL